MTPAPVLRNLAAILILLGACTSEKPPATPHLRVGHSFSNGNCALDADHKLTGLCVASDRTGTQCVAHEPDPSSSLCAAGLPVTETRVAACAKGQSAETVSREHRCFFVQEP
jgi:hypothetical protein